MSSIILACTRLTVVLLISFLVTCAEELETIKQNTIDTNRKNFRLLNRMLETLKQKPVQNPPDRFEKKKPKTIYEQAEASVRKKSSLKKMEQMKLAMLENKDLYYKLFKRSEIHKANEHHKMKQHRKQYMDLKSTLLKQKQKQRDYCRADINKQNKRNRIVLDKYEDKVENIRRRRHMETQKQNLLNLQGFDHLACEDLQKFLLELPAFDNNGMDVVDTSMNTPSLLFPESMDEGEGEEEDYDGLYNQIRKSYDLSNADMMEDEYILEKYE
ncbi:hypothetical protein WDU94_005949 [Cyamophila willieti]